MLPMDGFSRSWLLRDRLDSEDLVSESCVRESLVLFSLRRMILKRLPYFLSVFSLSLANVLLNPRIAHQSL